MEIRDLASRGNEAELLDVREENEWRAGHIPGSRHVPMYRLDEHLAEFATGRPVVTVCKTGSRSDQAAARLRAADIEAENLEGGIEAWVGLGLPLVDDARRPGDVVEPDPRHHSLTARSTSLDSAERLTTLAALAVSTALYWRRRHEYLARASVGDLCGLALLSAPLVRHVRFRHEAALCLSSIGAVAVVHPRWPLRIADRVWRTSVVAGAAAYLGLRRWSLASRDTA